MRWWQMEKNLTTGSVVRNIFVFALPFFFSYFLQTLYGMADLFIIGQFEGAASITAVSVGSQVMHMITVMLVGLAMGTTVMIAQAVGARNKASVRASIGNTITLFLLVAVVLAVVLVLGTEAIARWMSTPAEAVPGTCQYLFVCFLGIPLITVYNIISAIFRGLGDAKSPMYFVAVACVGNILLDYLFMGFWRLGPVGAAYGTLIAQGVSVVLALGYIAQKKAMAIAWSDLRPRQKVMGQLLRIGVPISLQDGFIQIAFLVITIIANMRGLTDAAAVGIVEKFISFVFLVPSSMLATVSALGAQNIGAGKMVRARKTLWYALDSCLIFGVVVSLLTQFTADRIVGIFTQEPAVIVAGALYLQGYIFDCIFAGIHFSFSGFFCALGRSEFSFLHNLIAIVTARIPLVWLASNWYPDTLFPMGLATCAGSVVSVVICLFFFWRLKGWGTKRHAFSSLK